MTRAQAVALVQRLHGIWSHGDVAAIPEVYAPGFVAHMPKGWGEPAGHRDGHAGIARAIGRIRASFPDWREEVEDVVFEGDRIVVRYVSTGTQTGPFLDRPPSGARVRVDEISIFRIADGRIAEQWCLNDDLAFFKQLDGAGG